MKTTRFTETQIISILTTLYLKHLSTFSPAYLLRYMPPVPALCLKRCFLIKNTTCILQL